MSTTRRRLAWMLLACAAISGCQEKPEAPVWDNPFDPSESGDPFHVQAVMGHNAVVVMWDQPDLPGIAGYDILRSLDGTAFDLAGQAGALATTFNDGGFAPNQVNFYKVRVRNGAGDTSAISRVVAAQILTAPWLEIAGGAPTVSTRQVMLTIRTEVGDTLELAASSDFAGAIRLPARPGETDSVAWDFGPAEGNFVDFSVWLRVYTGPVVSPIAHDSVRTSFNPDLQLEGEPETVATRRQTVVVGNGAGVTLMRFALSAAELPSAGWLVPDSIVSGSAYFTGDLLGPDSTAQTLHGEFMCDFGYTDADSLLCVPDSLEDAHFTIAGGDTITGDITVQLISSAVATEMRFSESPDLTGVPWQAYRDTVSFGLSSGGGHKVVYGAFRNDWFNAVALDSIFRIGD